MIVLTDEEFEQVKDDAVAALQLLTLITLKERFGDKPHSEFFVIRVLDELVEEISTTVFEDIQNGHRTAVVQNASGHQTSVDFIDEEE